jgi:hypothetical protein
VKKEGMEDEKKGKGDAGKSAREEARDWEWKKNAKRNGANRLEERD